MALNLILKNGTETGSTSADKINAAITAINTAELDTLPTTISTIESEIVLLQQEDLSLDGRLDTIETELPNKVNTSDSGTLSLVTTVESSQSVTTAFSKIGIVDSTYLDLSNGHMAYTALDKRITFNTTGVYQVYAQANVESSLNAEFRFKWYLNGVAIAPASSAVYITRGTGKPIQIMDMRHLSLTAGDYLEIFAISDATNTLVIKAGNIEITKDFS